MANEVDEVTSTLQGTNFLLDTELTVCNICGESHYTDSCKLLNELKPVKDTPTISHARLTLPTGLKVVSLADGTTTVIANAKFDRGTHFGPFQAPLTTDLCPGVSFPLKVIGKSGNDGYYLDTTDEETCNWMCLVAPASTASEQNLICYDMKQSIYFTAIKDILPGEELRVWYALYYGLKLQALPLVDESDSEESFMDLPGNDLESKLKTKTNVEQEIGRELLESLAQHLPAHSLGARMEKDRWQCRFCDKQEGNVALYAKHLMSHYRPQCDLCNRRFYSEKALSKHKKSRHANSETSSTTHNQNNINNMEISSSGSFDEEKQAMDIEKYKENLTVTAEDWGNNKEQIEPNAEENGETTLSDDKIDLDNYGTFCPLISVDKDNQEVITINNLNTSEIVHTQLLLAEDGSVVYHVANVPDGILATEMGKLGLLVVDNENCTSIGEAAEGVWSSQANDLVESTLESTNNQNNILENNELLQQEAEIEPYCLNDEKVELENGSSVALVLLNTLEDGNQSEQLDNQKYEINQQERLSEQCETLPNVDMQITSESTSKTEEPETILQKTRNPSRWFACDICSKTFEKSAYLFRHLRKHTGEFTCVNCLAVFARKENLQSHPCTRPRVRHPCHICGKKFSAKKYLQRHIPLHTGEFTCEKCKKLFVSKLSLACHRCRTDDMSSKDSIKCTLCEQILPDQIKLQSHLMHHSDTSPDGNRAYLPSTQATRKLRKRKTTVIVTPETKPKNIPLNVKNTGSTAAISGVQTTITLSVQENDSTGKNNEKGFICEICGSIFKSLSSMKTHRFLHGERRFECKICGKRFHRKDVLQEHITVHQSPQLPCSECGKKLKTKKSLEVHMMIHVGAKRFTCNDCGKEFYQKGNLLKHQRVHTPPADRIFPCQHCNKNFISREYLSMHTLEHTQGKIFECSSCSKSFVKKHLLEAHQQSAHSNRAFLCRYCNNFMRHRHSARRHLEQQHPEEQSEWSQPGFVDMMLATLPLDSLLLNSGSILPGQQDIRREQLLSLRRQHFGTNLMQSDNTGKEDTSGIKQSSENHLSMDVQDTLNDANQTSKSNKTQDLTMEEIATFALEQQVELLADPLLSNPQLHLDGINIIPVPFEEQKKEEGIILEAINTEVQQSVIAQNDTDIVVPISTSDTSVSKEENTQVTIGGNTYILQDRVIFEEDEMSSGDIFLYVLDSDGQQ